MWTTVCTAGRSERKADFLRLSPECAGARGRLFAAARGRGAAKFWKIVFRRSADFTWAIIEPCEQGELGSNYNGLAAFSWSRFEAPADFYGAQFRGPVFFWRTVFGDKVNLGSRL